MSASTAIAAVLSTLVSSSSWFAGTLCKTVGEEVVRQIVGLLVSAANASGIIDIERWTIDQYFTDLTEKAKNGEIRKAVGRENDLERLYTALSKQTKANVCVTGEAGVGKTALIEGFAYEVANGTAPEGFENVRVLKLNMVDLIVGRSFVQHSSCMSRMRAMFASVKAYDKKHNTKTIIFMDEFHQVVISNVAELCKQNFDREEFKCIAATTTSEYNKYIREDKALERRFPELRLSETNEEQTKAILIDRAKGLEEENNIKITDEAINESVYLPGRYMINRNFPDKAIDIINSAVKNARLKGEKQVTAIEVREEVERVTGIPISSLTEEDAINLKTMSERLNSNVVGQEEVVKKVCESVRSGRLDMADPNRPLGSFVFAGGAGVGKTLLAEKLGEEVGHIIRLDMSQYPDSKAFLSLLSKDGELPREIVKHPYSVILLDNIDRAGVETKNVVAEILDRGVLSLYNADQTLNFRNTYIIMTTTVESGNDRAKLASLLGNNLLSRTDNVLWFNSLAEKDIDKLARNFISVLRSKIDRCGYSVSFDESIFKYLSNRGISKEEGARGLRKFIDNDIGSKIISMIMNDELEEKDILVCSADDNGIKFEVKKNV